MQVPAGEVGDAGAAVKRVLGLLDPAPTVPDLSHGYLDLIGNTPQEWTGVAEWLMGTAAVPAIYQRWWRPALQPACHRRRRAWHGGRIPARKVLARAFTG